MRAHGRDAEAVCARSHATTAFAPGQRNNTGRTTARGQEEDLRETMRNGRGRERVAQHRSTAEQVGRSTRENTNATQHDDTCLESIRRTVGAEREEATAGVTARNARRR